MTKKKKRKEREEETYLPADEEYWEEGANPILAKTVRKVGELLGKAKKKTKKMAIAEMIDMLESEGYKVTKP